MAFVAAFIFWGFASADLRWDQLSLYLGLKLSKRELRNVLRLRRLTWSLINTRKWSWHIWRLFTRLTLWHLHLLWIVLSTVLHELVNLILSRCQRIGVDGVVNICYVLGWSTILRLWRLIWSILRGWRLVLMCVLRELIFLLSTRILISRKIIMLSLLLILLTYLRHPLIYLTIIILVFILTSRNHLWRIWRSILLMVFALDTSYRGSGVTLWQFIYLLQRKALFMITIFSERHLIFSIFVYKAAFGLEFLRCTALRLWLLLWIKTKGNSILRSVIARASISINLVLVLTVAVFESAVLLIYLLLPKASGFRLILVDTRINIWNVI